MVVGGRRQQTCPPQRRAYGASVIAIHHTDPLFQESLPDYFLYAEGEVPILFTENETNNERLFGAPNASPYVKDGINNYVVDGQQAAVNPAHTGSRQPRTMS